jgi:hypothetical protein
MCLNEICSSVWVGKHLFDMFRIKKHLEGDALLLSPFNFALDCVFRKVRKN